ncbi:MerR family DNA-binding transcriptional regulator [Rhizobacter sp. J219]|uniref:MerR family DNA-binding transcriptional regulator n=1 Tax=Rhizobacter sp. J219 TaxID=2898430 RepID=UPI002151E2E9|nr:MerR family DNA-binding transcriptional regulator [Rhizobacter sp. J219]MCR5884987.1 MerR family DNA-binding transcriptional regulator [Rhizobacter sp. J219]
MKISELARRTGVSVHRLRRYEDAGLIQAERRPSGYREFGERTVREVVFLSMGRDLGFSLQDLADAVPRYRAGTLTFEQMVEAMRSRIGEVDALIAEQRALRRRLVSHIGWLQQRQREAEKARSASKSAWPRTRKERP